MGLTNKPQKVSISNNQKDWAVRIQEFFGLREAVIAPVEDDDKRVEDAIGLAAAQYFVQRICDGHVVGVSCGRTIHRLAQFLPPCRLRIRIYPISYNVGPNMLDVMSPYATMFEMSRRVAGAVAFEVPIPAFFFDVAAEKQAFLARKDLGSLYERAQNPTAAFYSVGHVGPGCSYDWASQQIRNVIPAFSIDGLRSMGACGEINWEPFSRNGERIPSDISDHNNSLGLLKLKEFSQDQNRHMVLVAGGPAKVQAILGAVRGRYLNVLVTDSRTAMELWKLRNK